MTGSRVMTIFLHWWIFLIGEVASGRVWPYSLPSRLVFFLYWKKNLGGIFFKARSQQIWSEYRVIKKKCLEFVSSGNGVYPQIYEGEPKKINWLFCKYFFFSSWFPEILSGMPTQSELSLMWIKKMCGKYSKGEKRNIIQRNMYFLCFLFIYIFFFNMKPQYWKYEPK